MVSHRFLAVASILFALVSNALAVMGPENVAVVVNGDSWASLTVANEYRRLRKIPDRNFIVLTGLSSTEITDVDHFRQEILGPVFETLARRKLTDQIDCITYSVDIPYAVNVGSDMAGKKFPLVITGMASTNGLTYLHEWVEKKDTDYLRLDINRYNRRTLPLPAGTSLSPSETADYSRGLDLYQNKQYEKAAEVLASLLGQQRSDPDIGYDLACCLSLAGRPAQAIDALGKAVSAGWRNAVQTTVDPDLKPLSDRADFKALVERMKKMPIQIQPGVDFHSRYAWNERGEPAQTGPHYMLSTMLGVTCGRGNSVNQVLDSLRRSAKADGSMPKGTIYFPQNGDVRSTTRAWAFSEAALELNKLGVNAVVENGVLPVNRSDVAGAMIGISDFDWKGSKSTILPGAIVEHFTSFGGIISERSGQTPCTEFIAAGASGTSGTVTEPYALQQKFPTAFMQVQYCRGWSLAESYYQSVFGPYQLLIIGDPLCRPWARQMKAAQAAPVKNPGRTVTAKFPPSYSISKGDSIPIQVSCPQASHIQVYYLGRRVGEVSGSKGTIEVPTSLLGLGWISLQPLAFIPFHAQSETVVGDPIPIDIEFAEPLAPVAGASGEALAPGLALSVDEGAPMIVKDTFDGAWLSNLVKETGKRFTLSGTFEVSKEDLYQVQVKTNTGAVVEISGLQVLNAHDEKQLFAPVLLAPGRHTVQIIGRSVANSFLDIRLGSAGVQHLSEGQFKHSVR